MPHDGHRQILCRMNSPPNPQNRPAAPDEFGLVATGMIALVANRILETKDAATSATQAPLDSAREADTQEPR